MCPMLGGRSNAIQVALADGPAARVIDLLDDHARFALGAASLTGYT